MAVAMAEDVESPSARSSDAASAPSPPRSGLSPTAADQSNSSSESPKEVDIQASQRSEEYRQLFRLPSEEVLIRDYNCALLENFVLQGHMYVFDHYICFYSNIFGFETKKVIPLHEVTAVRRAKAVGIFPTALEIIAGEKKHFFTSFLSRDDAFKLIKDGWSQYGSGAKDNLDPQDTKLEFHSQDNGEASSSQQAIVATDFSDRQDTFTYKDFKLPVEVEVEDKIVSPSGMQDHMEDNVDSVVNNGHPSPGSNLGWNEEDCDAPKVHDSYTKVSDSQFPIRVEEFFNFFYSDNAVDFIKSYHERCGDKDFKCSSWYPHKEFGHARDVSFQHPIKVYLGAKCGSCLEVQKYRVYKNSHLVVETSQTVTDVPYGDYFHVEGLWDIERDGDDSRRSCIVRVYVNVVFSKKTIFKGKIVQATIDEARDAASIWIKNAHELLKRKKLEEEAAGPVSLSTMISQACEETLEGSGGTLEGQERANDLTMAETLVGVENSNHPNGVSIQVPLNGFMSFASWFRGSMAKFCASLRSRNQLSLLVITFALILLLMQLSIVVLLSRPQKIQMIPPPDYSGSSCSLSERKSEMMDWMEKRIHHLKDEMLMIESVIEKMRLEHKFLKGQLEDLEGFRRLEME